MTDDETLPTLEEILTIHADIVASDPQTDPGVRNEDAIESALQYISEGYFGESPDTIHKQAAHLMRLLVSEHPFVDGNKRTALNTVVVFYELNGYTLEYEDEPIRKILTEFAIDAEAVSIPFVVTYLRDQAEPVEE